MTRAHWKVAALLFFSGFCALVYQTVWLRQFRLIFGASTYATGAVLAIFMGGLGAGSAILGKRADAKTRPLAFYAHLELMISAAAAISPLLLWLAAKIYFGSGGSPQLGIVGATLLRLFLSALVLGPATLLMGGTLPAAARAVETSDDAGRRAVALLYGINTLGAVAGTLLSTFFLLETFGNRRTLFMAVLMNVLVGVIARNLSRDESVPAGESASASSWPALPASMIYVASGVAGFAFLLMELVWYRMLTPILGGTTYMFGLILAVALTGIGLGGAAYAGFRRGVATRGAFAMTCALEALALAAPFALGDRLAVFANSVNELGVIGFGGFVVAWTIVTVVVVFPASFIAGIQFPLLLSLLGRGREDVGRQIGLAYAWNTAGAIAGSLAGGFGLIPLLSAPGVWRMVVVILALLSVVFARRAVVFAATAIAALFATGPTAVWRHSGIGVRRVSTFGTPNDFLRWKNRVRRVVIWERDGRESSVAFTGDADYAFLINGKADGSAYGDAGTQIMLGMAGATLHPNPRSALVIGLGTGSTAGWLAAIPSMERVDVAELEPVILDVARGCRDVNAGAMTNPKLHVTIADAREMLLTSRRRYDLIASEPSNPYRAGIASLFTRDFYQAAEERLNRGGYFLQWLQMYAISTETLQTIYGTITSVFPNVQTWRTTEGDLMLLASREPVVIDVAQLRRRLAAEPYRSAIRDAWSVDSAEGFLSRHVANEAFARAAASEAESLNTDDRPVIEFGFARSLREGMELPSVVFRASRELGADRPLALKGTLEPAPPTFEERANAAFAVARRGDESAVSYAEELRAQFPFDADVVLAELRLTQERRDEAVAHLVRAFTSLRSNPWGHAPMIRAAIDRAIQIGRTGPVRARALYEAMSRPFAAGQHDDVRRAALIDLASRFDGCGSRTIAALRDAEPDPFWTPELLTIRARCYEQAGLASLAAGAWEDVETYRSSEPLPVVTPQSRPGRGGSF